VRGVWAAVGVNRSDGRTIQSEESQRELKWWEEQRYRLDLNEKWVIRAMDMCETIDSYTPILSATANSGLGDQRMRNEEWTNTKGQHKYAGREPVNYVS